MIRIWRGRFAFNNELGQRGALWVLNERVDRKTMTPSEPPWQAGCAQEYSRSRHFPHGTIQQRKQMCAFASLVQFQFIFIAQKARRYAMQTTQIRQRLKRFAVARNHCETSPVLPLIPCNRIDPH